MFLVVFVAVFGVAYFAGASSSAGGYSLTHSLRYSDQMRTAALDVPFYVRRKREFESKYQKCASHALAWVLGLVCAMLY